jgi:hypothetical protein
MIQFITTTSLPLVILLVVPSFSKTRISFEPRKLMAVGKSMPSTISSALSSVLSNLMYVQEEETCQISKFT